MKEPARGIGTRFAPGMFATVPSTAPNPAVSPRLVKAGVIKGADLLNAINVPHRSLINQAAARVALAGFLTEPGLQAAMSLREREPVFRDVMNYLVAGELVAGEDSYQPTDALGVAAGEPRAYPELASHIRLIQRYS